MKKRVLVVDDDRPVREALSKVLRQEGYDVVLAADGQQALEEVKSGKVDLLLLDLGLPTRSGWDAFERITTENPFVPVIIITGQASQYDLAAAAGAGALMEKPLDVPRLLETMKGILAEPEENRLHRLCGYRQDTLYVPCDTTLLLERLRKQHAKPYRHRLTGQK